MIEQKIADLIVSIDKNTAALLALVGKEPKAPPSKKQTPTMKSEEDLIAEGLARQRALDAKKDAEEEAAQVAKDAGPTKEQVAKAIEKCLKADKKAELIEALKGFGGATNATAVFAQGPAIAQKFIDSAEDLLIAE
jgi:hypothetical protein